MWGRRQRLVQSDHLGASKKPVDEGGWRSLRRQLFRCRHASRPQSVTRTNGAASWFGWSKEDMLEALRSQWMTAPDSEARQEFAAAIQERAFEVVPYTPTGQWKMMTAYRKNLKRISSWGR